MGHPCVAHEGHRKAAAGQGTPRLLEKKKLAHGVGPSKNKPSLLPPCHNAKRLAPGVSLPPKIMPGAATTPHGDALSMPPVSMVTTRNVARVTRRQVSWDLILKMRFWGCWVYFSPPPPLVLFLGFPSLPLLVWKAPPAEPLGQAAAASSRALLHLHLSCEAMAMGWEEGQKGVSLSLKHLFPSIRKASVLCPRWCSRCSPPFLLQEVAQAASRPPGRVGSLRDSSKRGKWFCIPREAGEHGGAEHHGPPLCVTIFAPMTRSVWLGSSGTLGTETGWLEDGRGSLAGAKESRTLFSGLNTQSQTCSGQRGLEDLCWLSWCLRNAGPQVSKQVLQVALLFMTRQKKGQAALAHLPRSSCFPLHPSLHPSPAMPLSLSLSLSIHSSLHLLNHPSLLVSPFTSPFIPPKIPLSISPSLFPSFHPSLYPSLPPPCHASIPLSLCLPQSPQQHWERLAEWGYFWERLPGNGCHHRLWWLFHRC